LTKTDTHLRSLKGYDEPHPESRLYRKADGRKAKLRYIGHALMENRHGLAVAGMVTRAGGTAERSLKFRSFSANC
jgi:hypothetical protein